MPRRCVARTLGIAAGGLLGFAVVPAAVAFADDYTIGSATDTETVTGVYGFDFGYDMSPPAVSNSVDGTQDFSYADTTTGDTGVIEADVSTSEDAFGDVNTEYLVTSDTVTIDGTPVTGTDAPPVGSVFDVYSLDDGEYEEVYSAIPNGDGGYTLTDTVEEANGSGGYTTLYTIPETFNAADVAEVDDGGVAIGDGDDIDPTGTMTLTGINGFAPLTMADLGTQTFDVDNASGTEVGSFGADVTTTTDGFGTETEAVLVTSDPVGSTVGTAEGDVPEVGSVFNTVDLGGDELLYSDLVSSTGSNVISDTLVTPFGDIDIPTTFDAAADISTVNAATIDVDDFGDITAVAGTADYTSVNGLPPVDVSESGTEEFDVDSSSGDGSFDADVTTAADASGVESQTILVTADLSGTPGTAAGDVPEVGSEINTVTLSDGYELIYSDLVSSTGTDVITDTLVTPSGDVVLPSSLDGAAALLTDILTGM